MIKIIASVALMVAFSTPPTCEQWGAIAEQARIAGTDNIHVTMIGPRTDYWVNMIGWYLAAFHTEQEEIEPWIRTVCLAQQELRAGRL